MTDILPSGTSLAVSQQAFARASLASCGNPLVGLTEGRAAATWTTSASATQAQCRLEIASGGSAPAGCTRTGDGSVFGSGEWTIQSPVPVTGLLTVVVENGQGALSPGNGFLAVTDLASGRIINPPRRSDPSRPLVAPPFWTFTVPIEIGPSGRSFLFQFSSFNCCGTFDRIAVSLEFEEGSIGDGVDCGPSLDAEFVSLKLPGQTSALQEDLVLRAKDIPIGATEAVFVFGTTDPNVVLPPTNCVLRTDPVILVPRAISNSQSSLVVPIEPAFRGLPLRIQFVAARLTGGAINWWTTAALTVAVP